MYLVDLRLSPDLPILSNFLLSNDVEIAVSDFDNEYVLHGLGLS